MNAFERPDILLTITLVIAERGDHPLKITDLIDLVCACDRGFRPASALEIVREWIPVALTQEQARAASASGVRTASINGWTWVTRGVKQERNGVEMAASPANNRGIEIAYEPAPEADQLRYRAQVAASMAAANVPPVLPAGRLTPSTPSTAGTDPATPPSDGGTGLPSLAAFDPAGLLTPAQHAALEKAGYHTADDIRAASDEQLRGVEGIGTAAVEKLRSRWN